MAERLKLSKEVNAKPLSEWGSVAVELLGTQTRIVQGKNTFHRVIEVGSGDPLILIHGTNTSVPAASNIGLAVMVIAILGINRHLRKRRALEGAA